MKSETYNLIKLTAEDGHKLYNENTIASTVFLGVGDNESNWREITQEEADNIIKEREEARKLKEEERLALLRSGQQLITEEG